MALGKILVADDDRNIAELLRLYLEKEGYTTELAADVEEAVAKFNADTPDLVLGHYDAQAGWLAGMPGDPQKVQLPDHYDHRQG